MGHWYGALFHLDSSKFPTFWNDCHDRACLRHTRVHSQAGCSGVFQSAGGMERSESNGKHDKIGYVGMLQGTCTWILPPRHWFRWHLETPGTWWSRIFRPVSAKENANFRQICPTSKNHRPQDVGASILGTKSTGTPQPPAGTTMLGLGTTAKGCVKADSVGWGKVLQQINLMQG